jgi:hypothetical protein
MISECDQLREAEDIAEAALRGDLPLLEAACILTSALIDTRLNRAEPTLLFNAVCSETDHLPIGRVREYWATTALREKDHEAADYEANIRSQFLEACREIIGLIGKIISE